MKSPKDDTSRENNRILHQIISRLTTGNVSSEAELPFYRTIFHNLIEKAPIGIYIIEEGSYSYVNHYFAALLGYTKEELTKGHVSIFETIHPDDYPILQRNIEKRQQGDIKDDRYRVRKLNKDGNLIYTEICTSMAVIYGKKVLFGSVIDITEQVAAEQQLEESNAQYKSLFDSSPDAIYSIDNDGNFINANPSSELLTGYSVQEVIGMPFMPLIASEDLPEAIKHFDDAKAGIPSSAELQLLQKDGKRIFINATHFPMRVNGKIVGTYGTARDITQKILYDQQMKELAFYDPLTRLPNRKLFEDRLGQMINLSRRDQNPLAILFLDLDRFKFINDSLGHQVGDEFLKLVAERLKQTIRKTDTLSRLAGDEFTILVTDTTQEEVSRLAESIHKILSDPFHVSGNSVTVTASIGVAFSTGVNDDVHELIRHADTAMYHTKKFKRNHFTIYSEELDLNASYKLTLERDLAFAVQNNEFELYYQPIMDLKSERISAMEALIRWHHPEIGLVPPNDFIPIAEESGQIIAIGTWVLETACRQNKSWQDAGIPSFKIAVNMSTKQLQQYNFIDTVVQILEDTKLDPRWLELEVTESILLDDVELIKDSLTKLKEIGVSISIDDFGTGYTSLSYLRQYPFDKVKIDKIFIDDISRNLNGKRITSAIISLAHSLNMDVVAEGIENETQLVYLKEEKCDGGQGYFFSRPMPVHSLKLNLSKK
ncbi:EAL domain-containing protein [Neobacillus terrae]|uniref:sensor domain-containing protein n=1 Tax=Neobacillus terrae TaxID=3034837 RepID=UPI00140AE212|nr:EAL domain-containing protein [Neobacillus terrae]NHM32403.1 EAL domain-containing protein [Neobacillus terrae]